MVDIEAFKKKYEDNNSYFLNSLLPEAKHILQKSLDVFANALRDNNIHEWSRTYFAVKKIAECMFLNTLLEKMPHWREFNTNSLDILTEEIIKVIHF